MILIATGSEVSLAMDTKEALAQDGVQARVVSLPCWEEFMAQPQSYQDEVLPPEVTARVAVEAGASEYWYRFVGLDGRVVGIDRFGLSALALVGGHEDEVVEFHATGPIPPAPWMKVSLKPRL